MAGSDRVLTRTIQSEPRLETRKPTKRAKWRSSMSAYTSVAQNVLDTADIVRDGDFSPRYYRNNGPRFARCSLNL